jgi:hypothetical protein
MRLSAVYIAIVVAIGGTAASSWFARYAPWVERRPSAPHPLLSRVRAMEEGAARRAGATRQAAEGGIQKLDPAVDARPPVADGALSPKAVAAERVYEFGHMGINETRKHSFRMENQGRVPLAIAKGPTECKCTISKLTTREVPPGGFAEIEIAWTPREADPTFEKSAVIWTNDRDLSEIRFRIVGKVGRALTVSPTAWHAGIVAEDHDGKAAGMLVSEVDRDFKILSVEPSDRNVTVSYKPMTSRALSRVGMLGGYEFTTSVGKGIPIGNFRSRLKILTTLDPKTPIDVELSAVRPGPIRFLSAVPIVGNARWNAEKSVLNLGRFRHEVGSKTELPALVYDMPGRFQVIAVKSSDSFLKVSVEPSQSSDAGAHQGIRFVFEVPPGSPPVNYFTGKPAHVTVQTNHPALKNVDFDLEFVCL